MPAILSYGPVNFEILELAKFTEALKTVYSQQPAVAVKPALDRTGRGLKEISAELMLSTAVGNVARQAATLEAIQEAGEAHPLSWANGRNLGEFVITDSISDILKTAADGTPYLIRVSLSFLEHLEDNTTAPRAVPAGLVSRSFRAFSPSASQSASYSLAQSSGIGLGEAKSAISSVSNGYGISPQAAGNVLAASQQLRPGSFGTFAESTAVAAPYVQQTGLRASGAVALAAILIADNRLNAPQRLDNTLARLTGAAAQTSLASLGIAGGNPVATVALVAASLAPLSIAEQNSRQLEIFGDAATANALVSSANNGSLNQTLDFVAGYRQRPIRHRALGI